MEFEPNLNLKFNEVPRLGTLGPGRILHAAIIPRVPASGYPYARAGFVLSSRTWEIGDLGLAVLRRGLEQLEVRSRPEIELCSNRRQGTKVDSDEISSSCCTEFDEDVLQIVVHVLQVAALLA